MKKRKLGRPTIYPFATMRKGQQITHVTDHPPRAQKTCLAYNKDGDKLFITRILSDNELWVKRIK